MRGVHEFDAPGKTAINAEDDDQERTCEAARDCDPEKDLV